LNLFHAERLVLRAPEQWKINTSCERLDGHIDRLAPSAIASTSRGARKPME